VKDVFQFSHAAINITDAIGRFMASFLLLLVLTTGIDSPVWAFDESKGETQSSEVLMAFKQKIDSLQQRSDKLFLGSLGPNNYHLSKARTWLDMATNEYNEKNTGDAITVAIEQAEHLLDALENNQPNITMDTPRKFPGIDMVLPEKWDQIAEIKKRKRFSCGQRAIAQAEVYLVWTSHEISENGWAHAQSYATTVDDMIYAGKVAIDICDADAAKDSPNGITPALEINGMTDSGHGTAGRHTDLEKITLSGDALFTFNKATLKKTALGSLDELARKFKSTAHLEQVILVGHTDRLRSDGHPERNQALSEQRAESIKQYLIKKGIAADKIIASGAGSTQPLVQCPTAASKKKQIECLKPNRRVEIILRGSATNKDNK